MSLKNKEYTPSPRLPSGGALDWDMTILSDKQLEYEYHLAYESLYGHTHEGVVVLKGLRDPEYVPPCGFKHATIIEANRVWSLRFSRAENELERRYLLS